jgi:hypothetical protein
MTNFKGKKILGANNIITNLTTTVCFFSVSQQSAWRGYNVRKRFNSTKFKKVRQRILVANSNVTEPMKLCNRTRSALDYLLKCKNLTTVREAFVHLGKTLFGIALICRLLQRNYIVISGK